MNNQIIKDTAEYNYKLGYNKAVLEIIQDLIYIDSIVPLDNNTNVFLRLQEIQDKWKSKEN